MLHQRHAVLALLALCLVVSGRFLLLGGIDQLQKGILLVGTVLLALRLGVEGRRLLFLAAFTIGVYVASVLKYAYAERHGTGRLIVSYLSLATPFLVVALRVAAADRDAILRLVAALPYISVIIGLLLVPTGLKPWVDEYTGAFRLRGALIAPHFAMLCVGSVLAGSLLFFSRASRWGAWAAIGSVLLALASGTRGASAAALLAVLPLVYSFLKAEVKSKRQVFVAAIVVLAVGAVAAAAVNIVMRNQQQLQSEAFNLSGRSVAWQYFWIEFKASPWWGYGLGAVTSLTKDIATNNLSSFVVPHNEFLRFMVDLGAVGAGLFFCGYYVALWMHFRSRGVQHRRLALLFVLAMTIYSSIDNTFSTPQMAVTWMCVLLAWPRKAAT